MQLRRDWIYIRLHRFVHFTLIISFEFNMPSVLSVVLKYQAIISGKLTFGYSGNKNPLDKDGEVNRLFSFKLCEEEKFD